LSAAASVATTKTANTFPNVCAPLLMSFRARNSAIQGILDKMMPKS
jgi:hypothetical protein